MPPKYNISTFSILLSWIFFGIMITACSPGEMMDTPNKQVLESDAQRILNPAVPSGYLSQLVSGNTEFSLDFYQKVRAANGNLFFSPYSLSSALAMVYGGARDSTASQMSETLHFTLPDEKLHPAFNQLDWMLRPPDTSSTEESQPFRLDIANSIWGQQGHPFKQAYLDLLAENYGAGIKLVDFIKSSEPARQAINQWVSENTQQKIQDLVPPGGVDASTRLVLANAIYFKADWLFPFANASTHTAPFYLPDGSQVDAVTMAYEDPAALLYYAGQDFQAVELPYAGGDVSMLVLLPSAGQLDAFESKLDQDRLLEIISNLKETRVKLFLPKFRFTSEYELTGILSELGMPDAFCDGSPNFSGMDEEGNLCVGGVFHKAFVAVDEKGTEAAAATAVVMKALAMMDPEVLVLKVDRPFIFMIRHNPSGAVLFMGRIQNPLK